MGNVANKRAKTDNLFIKICFVGLLAYLMGFINMYFWLLLAVIYLCTLKRIEIGVLMLLVGSSLFGRMFASQSLYLGVVVFSLIIGIILLHREILSVLNKNSRQVIFALTFILLFVEYFLFSPMTDYGKDKILKLSVRTLIWITTFLILSRSEKINTKTFSVFFLLLTLFYLSQAAQMYNVRAHGFLDFFSFRLEATELGRNDANTGIVNWQTLGYLSLASCVFWISRKKFWKGDKTSSILMFVCSFWIIAIAGARQTFFAFGIVVLIRYLLKSSHLLSASNIIKACLVLTVFIIIMQLIGSSYYVQVLENADTGSKLNRDINTPEMVMAINPTFGVGFGCYSLHANKDYPHNFFLEVICELGFVGLIIILSIIFSFIITSKHRNFLRYTTAGNSYMFLLFIVFFLRSQISGDVADSMSFICVLLACEPSLNITTNKRHEVLLQ